VGVNRVGIVATAPDWEVLLLDTLPVQRHGNHLRIEI
jgi:hypothetical protein